MVEHSVGLGKSKKHRLARRLLPAAVLLAVLGAQTAVHVATGRPAEAATGGLVHFELGVRDSETPKEVVVTCPSGTRVLGGGGTLVGGAGSVIMTRMVPASINGVDTYTVTAEERAIGYSGTWQIQAYAICGANLGGYLIQRSSNSTPIGASVKTVRRQCDGNRVVIGAGYEVNGGEGKVSLRSLFFGHPTPNITVTAADDTLDGFAPPQLYEVAGIVVCASPRPSYVVAVSEAGPSTSTTQHAWLNCPAGLEATAFGTLKSPDTDGRTQITALRPSSLATQRRYAQASAIRSTTPPRPWQLWIYAICTS